MTAIEIARRMAEMGATKDAVRAYTVAIHNNNDADPAGEMEAALYILQNGGDYKVSYGSFVSLHNRGFAPEDCVAIMTQAVYICIKG